MLHTVNVLPIQQVQIYCITEYVMFLLITHVYCMHDKIRFIIFPLS